MDYLILQEKGGKLILKEWFRTDPTRLPVSYLGQIH